MPQSQQPQGARMELKGLSAIMVLFAVPLTVSTNSLIISSNNEDGLEDYGAYYSESRLNLHLLPSLKDIHIVVTSNQDFEEHSFLQFLINHRDIAVSIAIRNETEGLHSFGKEQRHRCVTIGRNESIKASLQQYSGRGIILFCLVSGGLDQEQISEAADHMWTSRGVFMVYYISGSEVVFYNPYDLRPNGQYGALVDAQQRLHTDVFANMNGYPLRTYIFDSVYSSVFGDEEHITYATGADSLAADLLAQQMNFTNVLQYPDDEFFGARTENGSFNGAIGRMVRYETDVTMSGFFVKDYLTRDIDFTVSVYTDELCCYVMKAKRIPQSIVPLFAVELDIWLSFLMAGMLCPVVWVALRQGNLRLGIEAMQTVRKQVFGSFQYARIFIDTWVVWVRVNIVRFPPFYSERVFVISLCLVSVIFGALFESSLATVYIRPLYYKDIDSMAELDAANFRIYIKHAAIRDDLFVGHPSEVYKNLHRKILLVGESEERLIDMMAKRGGFTAVTRLASLHLNDIRYVMTNKIHLIAECPKKYHIAFMLPGHSPLTDPLNGWLLKFLAGGLMLHWIDEMKHRAKVSIYRYSDYIAEQGHKWKILTLTDLQLSFYALSAGLMAASVALLGEFAYLHWRPKKPPLGH